MSNSDNLKSLLDPRYYAEPIPNAYVEAKGEAILDHVESIIRTAQNIRDPLKTSRPEDLRAKYNISDTSLTGAALATEIEKRRNIGRIDYLQTAIATYLSSKYTFSTTPTVTVFDHGSLTDARLEDFITVTIQLPTVDDNSVDIYLKDPGLIAEVERVAPKWFYNIVNTTATRSANYIKKLSSDQVGHDWIVKDVIPDDIRKVVASSEAEIISRYEVKDVDWLGYNTTLRLADNIVDGEETKDRPPIDQQIRIETTSTYVSGNKLVDEQITCPPELLGGFEGEEKNITGNGIKAIVAKERKAFATYNIRDKKISNGEAVNITLLDPLEINPFTVVKERRLVDNNKKTSDILIGEYYIFHENITSESDEIGILAGQTIRVANELIDGGTDDGDVLVADSYLIFEQYLKSDANDKRLESGTIEVNYAREIFEGPSQRSIDKVPKKIAQDQQLSFRFKVYGQSDADAPDPPGGGFGSPGLTIISIENPSNTTGIISPTGFPASFNPDVNYIAIQTMNIESGFVEVFIEQPTGGFGTLTTGLVPFPSRPEFGMLPNAGECRNFGITVPDFFKLLSFGAGASPESVHIGWLIEFNATALYDVWEYEDPLTTGTVDTEIRDFSPEQTYPVVSTRLDGHQSFDIDEEQYVEPAPGWVDYPAALNDGESIRIHRLIYDKNKIPINGQTINAYCTYEISQEENAATVDISVPTPSGYICDRVDIVFGNLQSITVDITDPQIVTYPGSVVFKVIHLDTIINPTKNVQESINNVVLYYEIPKVTQDIIVSAHAHFARMNIPTMPLPLEDLQSFTFSTNSDLPIAGWFTLPTGFKVYDSFWTEAETGNIIDSPINRKVSGGIIYYFKEEQDEDGLFAEVWVTYGFPNGGTVLPNDIVVKSFSIPEGRLSHLRIEGITPETIYYIERSNNIIRTYINSFDIGSAELFIDKNKIPDGGVFLEVYATFLAPPIGSNIYDQLESFSADSQFVFVEANFEGIAVKELYYDTVESGILLGPLPDPAVTPYHVSNVLVRFENYSSNDEKIMVASSLTYAKALKQATYVTDQQYTVQAIKASGVVVREIWINGEFDKYFDINFGGISKFRPQRLESVVVFYYDEDLSTDEGTHINVELDVVEKVGSKINPWVGYGKWYSESGWDEQYRIDLDGVFVSEINVLGVSNTADNIKVIDDGIVKVYEPDQQYQPTSILLYFSEISSIDIRYKRYEPEDDRYTRHHIIYDNEAYFKSVESSDDEDVDILLSSNLGFNQLFVDFHVDGTIPDYFEMMYATDKEDFVSHTLIPTETYVVTATDYPIGSTQIKVATVENIKPLQIVKIGDYEYVRVVRINADTNTLFVDPTKTVIKNNYLVKAIGIDTGNIVESGKFLFRFHKNGKFNNIAIRQIRPRIVRRFFEKAKAANVLYADATYWSSLGSVNSDSARLTLAYNKAVRINFIDFLQEYDVEFTAKYTDEITGVEKEFFIGKGRNAGYIYLNKDEIDSEVFSPNVIKTRFIEFSWANTVRNGDTGLFQTKVIKAIPQFVYDALDSKLDYALDPNPYNRFASIDTSYSQSMIEVTADMKHVYKINRLWITTPSAGTRLNMYYSLGDATIGYQLLGVVPDIAAPNPSDVITTSLSANSGVGQTNEDRVFVSNTSAFEIGDIVKVYDDAWPHGEKRKIVAIVKNQYLVVFGDFLYGYTTARNAKVELGNVVVPGWENPIIAGVNVAGEDIRGPRTFRQAYILPEVYARYVRFRFTNLQEEMDRFIRNVRVNRLELFNSVTVG